MTASRETGTRSNDDGVRRLLDARRPNAAARERERARRSLNAAEEERRRWARELHDETLQGLAGLRVLLSSARRSSDVGSLHAAIDSAVTQITSEIANLRSLITELRPAALDELGLAPALETLIDRVRRSHGLEIETTLTLAQCPRLDPDVETTVYRLVQESLTNAARHSSARRLEVVVLEDPDEVQVAIRDDGHGFDVDTPTAGLGLTGMRERILLAGGTLEISSSAEGTAVVAALPAQRCGEEVRAIWS